MPATHLTHEVDDSAPPVAEKRPAAQPVHSADPEAIAYWPAAQLLQALALPAAKSPAPQVLQVVDDVAATGLEYVPSLQPTQATEPVAA